MTAGQRGEGERAHQPAEAARQRGVRLRGHAGSPARAQRAPARRVDAPQAAARSLSHRDPGASLARAVLGGGRFAMTSNVNGELRQATLVG